ncbi:response regulator [Paenibacillus sp. LHD-117]|uniref:response regulator n=1 Tax=Paenibacillus sp. LHD-117 TaxID=3071412 RepID=UPI0027DFBC81|nr:response regulator [Paenibacillus sp. LHD-117]MDQ6417847.1 response regulator [Paenibacillus sp. LHD-117]
MYRLLIVDDEEIITDGLYEVFHQLLPESLDICKAYSAKEALNWLARTRIDIVLTDIRMPGMSGLELSEEIQKYWPRCKVIFLTGFSEFDYAYKAIQIPFARYILKTEGYDKVIAMVQEVIQELNHDIQMNQLVEQSRIQMDTLERMAQENYFRHILQNAFIETDTAKVLAHDFEELNIGLDPNDSIILVLGRLSYSSEAGFTERSKILASTRMIWNTFLGEQTRSIGIIDKLGDILWIIQPLISIDENFNQHLIRYLEGTLELVQDACQASLQSTISFTVSGTESAWEDISTQYERLRQLQQLKVGTGLSMILIDRSNETGIMKEGLNFAQKIEVMEAHLEGGKPADFFTEMDMLSNLLLQVQGNVQKVTEGYYSIALLLLAHINRLGLHGQIGDYGKLMRIDDHPSMKDGFIYLRGVAEAIFQHKNKDERDRASQVIEKICHFIENHLEDDLSLVRLAEIHYFNPSYLSRFFKQEYGSNLSEYIDKCRIRRAKELLKDADQKVRDVANAVGYEAAHSFTRFFKKATGMTPQEYRDSLIISEGY